MSREPLKHPYIEGEDGSWTALNAPEPDDNDDMWYSVLEYLGEGEVRNITTYSLTHEQAWRLVEEHNSGVY